MKFLKKQGYILEIGTKFKTSGYWSAFSIFHEIDCRSASKCRRIQKEVISSELKGIGISNSKCLTYFSRGIFFFLEY